MVATGRCGYGFRGFQQYRVLGEAAYLTSRRSQNYQPEDQCMMYGSFFYLVSLLRWVMKWSWASYLVVTVGSGSDYYSFGRVGLWPITLPRRPHTVFSSKTGVHVSSISLLSFGLVWSCKSEPFTCQWVWLSVVIIFQTSGLGTHIEMKLNVLSFPRLLSFVQLGMKDSKLNQPFFSLLSFLSLSQQHTDSC